MMVWMLSLGFVMISDNTETINVDLKEDTKNFHTVENLNKIMGRNNKKCEMYFVLRYKRLVY